MSSHIERNVERFSGFADTYDSYRPQPPAIIVDILTRLARIEEPKLVADIGSGTGLSTRIWAGRARQVIGIEPNPDMRREAELRTAELPDVSYREGMSTATGLPDGCADIVTCSQSFHWMDPQPTFAEIARILRDGGVFAAYDCDWPPTMNWEAELAYREFTKKSRALQGELGITESVMHWPKDAHLAGIQESGLFRYVKEIAVHSVESGNAERLVGLALSFGGVAALLKRGLSEDEIGITELRNAAQRILGDQPSPWYFSYRIRLGVK